MTKRTTKKTQKTQINNLMQGGHYSVAADNISKAKKHVQYSVVSEKIEMTETRKTDKKKRTKNI